MERAIKPGALATYRDRLPSSSQYELLLRIASGGMATVYVGRRSGALGFSRLVAIKRAHAHLLEDPAFSEMLVSEAKIASRIHHPNVVAVQAVEVLEGELLLVMDYVEGASLSELVAIANRKPLPVDVTIRILLDACAGLHAAHTARDDFGNPLGLVHRDVSPQNILVGVDGIARVSDFGVAKSTSEATHGTATGTLKGKVSYMAPEYIAAGTFDVRSDVFALGIVAWEMLAGRRLFRGQGEVETLKLVLATQVEPPSRVAPWLGEDLDGPILRALARDPAERFASVLEFSEAIERAARKNDFIASSSRVAELMRTLTGATLDHRRSLLREGMAAASSESAVRVVGRSESTNSMDVDLGAADAIDVSVDAPSAHEADFDSASPPSSTLARGVTSEVMSELRPPRRARAALLGGALLAFSAMGMIGLTALMRADEPVTPASAAVTSTAVETTAAAAPPATTVVPSIQTATPAATIEVASEKPAAPSSRGSVRLAVPVRKRSAPAVDRAPPNPYLEQKN